MALFKAQNPSLKKTVCLKQVRISHRKEINMRKLKCLLMSLVLLLVVSASALAGETQGPNDPGEMNAPPGETSCPPGETQTPPAPGDMQGPGFADYLWTIGAVAF